MDKVFFDGLWWEKDKLPDIGDLDPVESTSQGMRRDYVGITATVDKFPTYVESGSTIKLLKEDGMQIHVFHRKSQKWVRIA